jgi:O-antigen/teichoic acid export membrane protein
MKIIKKVINQTSWQLLAKIISSISTLAVLSIISRQYGVDGVGLYTLALTYLAVFYLLADLGLNGHVLADLELNPKLAEQLWRFRVVWGLALIGIANILVWFIPGFGVTLWLPVLAGSFSILGSAINNSCNLWFQKRLTYQFSSSPVIFSALVMLPLYWLYGYLKLPIESLTVLVSFSSAPTLLCKASTNSCLFIS